MIVMVRGTGQHEELFVRYSGNPTLTAADWPYPVNSVFNPGATRLLSAPRVALAECLGHEGGARRRGAADGSLRRVQVALRPIRQQRGFPAIGPVDATAFQMLSHPLDGVAPQPTVCDVVFLRN